MFRLMEKARKNNKGFSLVELIVVVLIIAIIAVALAPQVVKYVQKSRTNVGLNNAATIKSSVQAAVAEYTGQVGITGLTACGFYVDADDSSVEGMNPADSNAKPKSSNEAEGNKSLKKLIEDNLGDDKLDQNYGVTITSAGKVAVDAQANSTTAPTAPTSSN